MINEAGMTGGSNFIPSQGTELIIYESEDTVRSSCFFITYEFEDTKISMKF